MEKVKSFFGKICFVIGLILFVLVIVAIMHPRISIQPEGVVVFLVLVSLFMLLAGVGISEDSEHIILFSKIRLGIVFFLYWVLLYQCVFGKYVFARNYGISNYNFIPLKTIMWYFSAFFGGEISKHIIIYNIFGNLILLAPFGIFLPCFLKKFQSAVCCLVFGALCSLIIEITQSIFCIGSFDVDDVLLNTIGVGLFYLIIKMPLVEKIMQKGKIVY